MSDGITDSERQKREDVERWRIRAKEAFVSELSIKELADELCKREGVTEYSIPLEGGYTVHAYWKGNDRVQVNNGPARILVVTD
ncbi:MAG: BC1881 family protein [Nitrospirales bacterium]|nr:MAG: BC1881 family protein [Nitrospirales bacterium]